MKLSIKKILKVAIPLSIGLFFIWYSLYDATKKEKKELWDSIVNANPFWVCLSALIGVLSHVSRAYRWKYLVEGLGKTPRLFVSYTSLMVGYLANLGVPRSGELLRAAMLSNYENIPFQKTFGTIISERIIDLIMLLLLIIIGLSLSSELFISFFEANSINPYQLLGVLLLLMIFLIFGYFVLRKANIKALEKIRTFILEIYDGILSVFKMKKRGLFIAHSFFIWIAYVAMFYVMKFAIPEVKSLEFSATLLAFIAGSFAMMATNGGIGTFPYTIGLVLLGFNIDKSIGNAYGWILWSSQTLMNLFTGCFSFILLSFFFKKK